MLPITITTIATTPMTIPTMIATALAPLSAVGAIGDPVTHNYTAANISICIYLRMYILGLRLFGK